MKTIQILLVFSFLFLSCQQEANKEELRNEILAIHHNLIRAHLEKDPGFFVRNLSDNFLSVKDGDILHPDIEEYRADMDEYIQNTTFTEYRDLQEPIIGFSGDRTVAWAIFQVVVRGERNLPDGTVRKIDFTCAWLTLYRKVKDDWVVEAEVSTFK